MERRVLVAIFLSFLVLYTYQALFIKPAPKPESAPGQQITPSSEPAASSSPSSPQAESPATEPRLASGDVVVGDAADREITIETQDVVAIFTNRGAKLKSWRLKRYLDSRRQPVELIANDLANAVLPFSLQLEEERLSRVLNDALYSVAEKVPTGVIDARARVSFEFRNSEGVEAKKTFAFEPSGYIVEFSATISAGGRALTPTILWGPALGDIDSGTGRYAVKPRGLALAANSTKVERIAVADVAKQPSRTGDYQFAGVDDHYFMTAALAPGESSITYQHLAIPPADGSKQPARELMSYSIRPGRQDGLRFYVGPKDFDQLKAVNNDLTRAVDFGIFAIVVVPLLRALNGIHGVVGNYGWSIIILTVLINAAMFPLRHKSVVSMRKMQEIQPEAKAIQDRYAKFKASDPEKQKMNQELMALYRERGVNPASGCVPMLLTFPVLFAFYALLTTAIELRGAPFFGWIHDLSLPDPYYVTPILMGISQIWQTRITPQAGADPAQQKMMMFMPVLFMFFFLWAPAGVAIYWFISNIWGIGQQYLTTYLIGPPKVRAMRPAAERRVKRAGSGKTEAAAREN